MKKKMAFILSFCLAFLFAAGCVDGVGETESPYPSASAQDPVLQSPTPEASPEQTPEPEKSPLLEETEDMGQTYLDSIVFLGDSTTYGLKYYAVLPEGRDTKQVWTPVNGTLTLSNQSFATILYPETGEELPIREAAREKRPEILIITLGVNGVSFMDESYFKSEYENLVTDLQAESPDTKIILQSIFPVAENYEYINSINPEKITRANGWILEVAQKTGVSYLATETVLAGEDGFLRQEYQNGDGMHLNETGFALVLEYIRTHGLVD